MPTDGSAFKDNKEICPIFKEELHNVRLSMETYRVNPFGEFISIYLV
jgi:hypothetical protein